ncbi:MAG TPA: hypothetical protein VF595_08115, partial [Tepidisphaeraceae bacterium]
MEKILDFLEKHVQWLAISLGGLFLAWTLWTYVLMAPVTVPGPSGSTLGPGEVDDHVGRTQTERVEQALKVEGPVQPPLETSASAVIRNWSDALKGSTEPLVLAGVPFNSKPSDFKIDADQRVVTKGELVTALPAVPPSETVEIKAARAYAGPSPSAAAATPPPAPAAAVGATSLPPGRDMSYVRVGYRILTNEIAKSFDEKKVPRDATTGIVAVKLMRQESMPDGTWTAPIEVPYIKNDVTIFPIPAAGAGPAEINGFRTWSDSPQGQSDLLRPTFYHVIFGEGPWDPPMDELLPKWDPEAIRAEKARAAKELQDSKRRAAPTPRAPAGGGGRRGGGGNNDSVAPDPQRPVDVGGLLGVQYQPPRPPAAPGGGAGAAEAPLPAPANAAVAGMPPAEPLPTPSFQPPLTAPFQGWAYDETVVEGHTYRYQVLYALRSPVFASNVVQPPELAQLFAIWSELDDTKWSEAVEVKPTAEFYLAGTNWAAERTPANIKIEVFKWAQGRWQ